MSLYLKFPEYKLASGRYARVEIFTQDVTSGIGACYNNPANAVTAIKNPWLQGGLPVPVSETAADAGLIGSDAVEFSYCGVTVYNGSSLHAVIMSEAFDTVAWNIRLYTKPIAAATFPLRPDFWGIIDASEPDGEIMSFTSDGPNKYKLIARNRLCLLERVQVNDWITGFLPYNTAPYEIAPDNIMIDGYELNRIFFPVPGSDVPQDWPSTYVRFIRVRDVLQSISDAIGITESLNIYDTIRSSWVFHGTDGNGDPTTHTADDLVIVSGTRTPTYWYWHYTFFDWETNTSISFFNVGDIMQVLKQILVPLGLQASVEVRHRTGLSYLEVREVEQASGVVAKRLIRGATLEPGETAARGIRIVVAEDGEFSVNGSGDQNIECCFQSATRLRAGERWIHPDDATPPNDQDTDDVKCLMGSLYVYDSVSNVVSNVTGITVANDGRSPALVTPAGVTLGLGGKMIGEAAARYYYSQQNTGVSELGVFRPATQQLEFRMNFMHDDIEGVTTHFATGKLYCTGAFALTEDVYKYRRVRNDQTGAEASVTARDSADALSLSADIFPAVGHPFVILGPRTGHFVEMPNGSKWTIRSLALNSRECTQDITAEKESFDV